jgi:uncharacterized BrkB/YihY/UPF0761 family membrane protein
LLKCAATNWSGDQAATIGAALAFYCAFSLAPLLVIVVTLSGWIVGAEAAYGYLGVQLQSLFGAATADILLDAMRSSNTAPSQPQSAFSVCCWARRRCLPRWREHWSRSGALARWCVPA